MDFLLAKCLIFDECTTIVEHTQGNYNELREVIELAKQGKVKHTVSSFSLNAINEATRLLRSGQVDERAIIIPKKE